MVASTLGSMFPLQKVSKERFPKALQNNLKMKGHTVENILENEWKIYENITMHSYGA